MAFPGGHFRSATTSSVRGRMPTVVFPIGRRVFACTVPPLARVTLTDDSGQTARGKLRDGVELEIVAWRPHGPQGTRYLVRAASDGIEGWLCAAEVRGSKAKAAAHAPTGKMGR